MRGGGSGWGLVRPQPVGGFVPTPSFPCCSSILDCYSTIYSTIYYSTTDRRPHAPDLAYSIYDLRRTDEYTRWHPRVHHTARRMRSAHGSAERPAFSRPAAGSVCAASRRPLGRLRGWGPGSICLAGLGLGLGLGLRKDRAVG